MSDAREHAPSPSIAARLRRARKRAGGRGIDAFFRGLSTAGRLHPKSRPERHGVEVLRDVPYEPGEHPEHKLDVYRPCDVERAPVVLYVHGGGFRILSKDTHWMMALAFARRGYVVFNVDYRLAPRHPYPGAIQDVLAAWTWVVRNAAAYGGDPARIVVAGESAGGNLVTGLTVATCYRREEPWARAAFDAGVVPIAAVPACGILEVSRHERFREKYPHMPGFVADRIGEVAGGYLSHAPDDVSLDLADPLVVLERGVPPDRPLPPIFAPCGTRDPLLDDSRRLAAAARRLGGTCDLIIYPGELHAFHAFLWRENARKCWDDTFAFLDEHAPVD